jgi:hypothetical protein
VGPRVAGVCLVLLAVAGCASEKDPGPSRPSPQQSPAPQGGTPDQPVALDAGRSLLEWVPAPGAVANTMTTNGSWFLTVEAAGRAYRLDGPDQSFGAGADDTRITNALLDADWAVVVRQDLAGKQPAIAEVTDLSKGDQFTIDAGSDVPTIAVAPGPSVVTPWSTRPRGRVAASAWPRSTSPRRRRR